MDSSIAKFVGIILGVIIIVGIGAAWGCPSYNVYSKRMDGQAQLAQAESSKQVAVQASKAKQEAAQYEAQAEITRAGGLAASIKITGEALQKNPEYLRYLYVNNLAESHDQIIYVPTEAGLPILEAGRGAALHPSAAPVEAAK